jgi:hypothetical protein
MIFTKAKWSLVNPEMTAEKRFASERCSHKELKEGETSKEIEDICLSS